MSSWEDRAQAIRQRMRSDEKARERMTREIEQKQSLLAVQREFAYRIGNEVICHVLKRLNEIFTDEPAHPVVHEVNKRVLTVSSEVNGLTIAIEILLLATGSVQLTVFGGQDQSSASACAFGIDDSNEQIEEWFGETVIGFFRI